MLNFTGFRHSFLFLALALGFVSGLQAEIKEVVTEYRQAQDFKRIREYFTGKEFTGRRLITRSQAEERQGYYFVITLKESVRKLPTDATVQVSIIEQGNEQPVVYNMALPEKRPAGREIFAGLTGSDWPDSEVRPLAWRIALLDGAGNELDGWNSYLWKYEE